MHLEHFDESCSRYLFNVVPLRPWCAAGRPVTQSACKREIGVSRNKQVLELVELDVHRDMDTQRDWTSIHFTPVNSQVADILFSNSLSNARDCRYTCRMKKHAFRLVWWWR